MKKGSVFNQRVQSNNNITVRTVCMAMKPFARKDCFNSIGSVMLFIGSKMIDWNKTDM